MKRFFPIFLLATTALTLASCGEMGEQWVDPDITFSKFDQPDVQGINDTQEEMAKQAMANGEYQRAAQFYQQLVASKKGTEEQLLRYKMGLADATRRLGQTQVALTMYDQLFRENPANLDIAEGRGLALMGAGKVSDAGRVFSTVIEKDPKRWRSLNALALLFVTKNMIPESMAYYNEALNHSPDNAAVLNNMGLTYAIDRNFPKAVEALEYASRVSKVSPQQRQIELNLALVHGVAGNMEMARTIAGKHLEGAALDNNMGLYAHLKKDDALAKSYLNMALSQSPIYYKRAWENLDKVTDSVRSDRREDKAAKTLVVTSNQDVAEPPPKKVVEEVVSTTPPPVRTSQVIESPVVRAAAEPVAEQKPLESAKPEEPKPTPVAGIAPPEPIVEAAIAQPAEVKPAEKAAPMAPEDLSPPTGAAAPLPAPVADATPATPKPEIVHPAAKSLWAPVLGEEAKPAAQDVAAKPEAKKEEPTAAPAQAAPDKTKDASAKPKEKPKAKPKAKEKPKAKKSTKTKPKAKQKNSSSKKAKPKAPLKAESKPEAKKEPQPTTDTPKSEVKTQEEPSPFSKLPPLPDPGALKDMGSPILAD